MKRFLTVTAVAALVIVLGACAARAGAPRLDLSLSDALATAIVDDAQQDFVGLTQDTVRWRLSVAVAGVTSADSLRIANEIQRVLGPRVDDGASREVYAESTPAVIRRDIAVVEARLGARWTCGTSETGSFAAYRYTFARTAGAWRIAERLPTGYGDAAPCQAFGPDSPRPRFAWRSHR